MKNPSDILTEVFARMKLRCDVGHSPLHFSGYFSGDFGRWPFIAVVGEDPVGILILSFLPVIAPIGRRPVCVDLLNRINYGLLNGGFEMDPDDGRIRFRTMLPVAREGGAVEVVERLVGTHLKTVDNCFPAIMRVVYAGLSALEALAGPANETASTRRFELN